MIKKFSLKTLLLCTKASGKGRWVDTGTPKSTAYFIQGGVWHGYLAVHEHHYATFTVVFLLINKKSLRPIAKSI